MSEEIFGYIEGLCRRAKDASRILATADTEARNRFLTTAARLLRERTNDIIAENGKDLAGAEENGVRKTMLDRLALDEKRIESMACALCDLVALPDPIGQGEQWTRPNGLVIRRTRVPLGVVGVIYEARPNVTVDVAALCIKTGNAVVLRGGKEALASNLCLASLLREALEIEGLPADAVQVIERPEREGAQALMQMRGLVDVLIPRGGKGLIRAVVEGASVPVIETGAGNCHIYVDDSADVELALRVTENAKLSRPSVCNAAETLLVHEGIADRFLPALARLTEGRLALRGCEQTCSILPFAERATEEDYETEYNDCILAVRIVPDLSSAITHINRYTTGHSEAIMTGSLANAARFRREVDAACVYVNASTRFSDGGEFGFGAEVGISTQKLHARGPMGPDALTTVKYEIEGNGQIR